MDITAIIAARLTQLMNDNENLSTFKKVAKEAGVGFGTIQRAKNGTGNITVQNLAAIAAAFKLTVSDLLTLPNTEYPKHESTTLVANSTSAARQELQSMIDQLDERGCDQAIGVLRATLPEISIKGNFKQHTGTH